MSDVSGYDPQYLPFDTSNPREVELRSPGPWLQSIKGPTFVLEGTGQGNIGSLQAMASATKNPSVHFHAVKGANHFNILAPTNALIAQDPGGSGPGNEYRVYRSRVEPADATLMAESAGGRERSPISFSHEAMMATIIRLLVCITVSSYPLSVKAGILADPLTVDSPDGRLRVTFRLDGAGRPGFDVAFRKRPVATGNLGLEFAGSGPLHRT